MNVFVTGATGVLGYRLVDQLATIGHTVYGLARDEEGADVVAEHGGIPRRGDVLDKESLREAIDDVGVVVHAATSIPTETNPSRDEWVQNNRIRVDGTRNLVDVIGHEIGQFVFPSIVWLARQPDGSWFDEDADRHPDLSTQGAMAVEDYLQKTAPQYGFEATVLRCGFFYANDAANTRQFGHRLLAGKMPIVGGGVLGRKDAPMSRVHVDDAASAFAKTVDEKLGGVYHVVDNEPVSIAAYLTEFARHLDAPEPGPRIPGWVARWLLGKITTDLLTKPMPTTNTRFCKEVDWEPSYPTYREGLAQIVETWKTDGTIRESHNGYEWVGTE